MPALTARLLSIEILFVVETVTPTEGFITRLPKVVIEAPPIAWLPVPLKVTVPPVATDVPSLVQLPFKLIVAVAAGVKVPELIMLPFITIAGEDNAAFVMLPVVEFIRLPVILIDGVPEANVENVPLLLTLPFTFSTGELEQV